MGIRIIFIAIYMKIQNKPENISEEINLSRWSVISQVISTLLLAGLFILIVPGTELNLVTIVIVCSISACQVYSLIVSLIVEHKYIFDYTGFVYLERNKTSAKETRIIHRWEDVKYIRISIRYIYKKAYLLVIYKNLRISDATTSFPYALSEKFTKLAIKYSGRNNIVRSESRKRKMYEKDW